MNRYGNILKELRESSNKSQMELSKEINISQSSIARYELNKTEPKASDIKKYATYFNVSADYIIGLKDY